VATVCALNNYPLAKMWALARAGAIPRQHTWGIDALAAAGHAVELAPFHEPQEHHPLDRLSGRLRGAAGHLDQEAFAVGRMLRGADTVYCADGTGLAGIALVRRLLPRARLVSVVHHPIRNRIRLAAAARQDALLCLSPAVRAMLARDLPRRRPALLDAPWGPALDSPLYRSSSEQAGVVSAGKSNRDLRTLAAALARVDVTALVYDLEGRLPGAPGGRIEVRRPGDVGADPDSPGGFLAATAIGDTARAAIVAIPIGDPNRLTGLTEAADALALGKPILATRTPYFPFDLEEVGCGLWLEPGDVDGWARALERLAGDAALRRQMGDAGRRFAERVWNYDAFCAALSEALSAPGRSAPARSASARPGSARSS
jgi:hypothetical protein